MDTQETIDCMHARARLQRKPTTVIELSLKTGESEAKSASLNVPSELLTSGRFGFTIEELLEDAFKVHMIQVWAVYYINDVRTTETFFVPVLGWQMLSVKKDIIIEDYVHEKLFHTDGNESAPAETKRTGPATFFYRRDGKSGDRTRKERLHDWLVGLTGRGRTIFFYRFTCDWSVPMPAVKPPREATAAA